MALHSIWTDKSLDLGVIYSLKAEVRSEPNTFSTRLFEVHEGLKVSISQLENDWVEIELLDEAVEDSDTYILDIFHILVTLFLAVGGYVLPTKYVPIYLLCTPYLVIDWNDMDA